MQENKQKTIFIEGEILCDGRMDGIHRFMLEVLTRMDEMLPDYGFDIALFHSEGKSLQGISLQNIKEVPVKKKWLTYRLWDLPEYIRKHSGIYCSMSNDVIWYGNSICTLMDLIPLSKLACYPMKSLLKMKLCYWMMKKKAARIVTISNASRQDIIDKLGIPGERISLVGTGWEHMKKIGEEDAIFERFPNIRKGTYYYAIGNQYPYKNFIWVKEAAKRNPQLQFVVAGKVTNISTAVDDQEDNMTYVGYISDAEHKALLKNARGFLHPSKLEGFGIPPLEALSQGIPAAVARASCLPEIYQNTVHYFEPDDYDVDLEQLFSEPVDDCEELLKRYSWDQVAQDWMKLFGEFVCRQKTE